MVMNKNLPSPIIATVSNLLQNFYIHDELDEQFVYADAPGEPPTGNKSVKIKSWLVRCNKTAGVNPFQVLGKLMEDFMEREMPQYDMSNNNEIWRNERETFKAALARYGYSYFSGGIIRNVGSTGATQTLEDLLRNHDHTAIDDEFKRTMENIESDPPTALTSACAIVESLCNYTSKLTTSLICPKKKLSARSGM